jgi:hypothetical protein
MLLNLVKDNIARLRGWVCGLSYCVNSYFQVVVPPIWQQRVKAFVSPGLRKIPHEVCVTIKTDPSISRKYPAFVLDPVLRFFFTVTPVSILNAVLSFTSMTHY